MRLPRFSAPPLLACALALGACQQTPRILVTPIQPLRDAELECSGRFERAGFDPLPGESSELVERPLGTKAELLFRTVPRELAAEWIGSNYPTLWSGVVPRSEAQRLWRSLPNPHELIRSNLDLCSDGPSYATWEKETAFVTGFELETRPEAAILDPVVETMRSGLRISMEPRAAEESDESGSAERASDSSFTLHIEQLFLQHPVALATAASFFSEVEVQFQTPIFRRVDFRSQAELNYDEALLILGPSASSANELFVATLTVLPSTPAPNEQGIAYAND